MLLHFTYCSTLTICSRQDKRQTVDGADKAQLQKCLEQLQGRVKFHSLQGMLDRLEGVAKQLG